MVYSIMPIRTYGGTASYADRTDRVQPMDSTNSLRRYQPQYDRKHEEHRGEYNQGSQGGSDSLRGDTTFGSGRGIFDSHGHLDVAA